MCREVMRMDLGTPAISPMDLISVPRVWHDAPTAGQGVRARSAPVDYARSSSGDDPTTVDAFDPVIFADMTFSLA
jgi:hypothetical protein